MDSKIAAALLGAVTTAALDTALLGKADARREAGQVGHAAGGRHQDTVTPASRRSRAPRTPRSLPARPLDAILAELTALQLSGGVVNAPAWAGFTTWELVRGSNVVCNLHLEAPLATADCYSIAAADAALAAALLFCFSLLG